MKIYKILIIGILHLGFSSCGGGDSSSDDIPPVEPSPEVLAPTPATLIFPENNTECNEGVVSSSDETKSTVPFEWNAGQNTDSYEINLKNLETNGTQKSTSTSTEKDIIIDRGVPYEWFVVSKASGTNETATSPVFVFYNQGPGLENYAPFPATAVNPKRGSSVPNSATIILEWSASDLDEDITSFEILFGTLESPENSLGTTEETTIQTDISPGNTYYWQIITKDANENSSNSEIFNFQVL